MKKTFIIGLIVFLILGAALAGAQQASKDARTEIDKNNKYIKNLMKQMYDQSPDETKNFYEKYKESTLKDSVGTWEKFMKTVGVKELSLGDEWSGSITLGEEDYDKTFTILNSQDQTMSFSWTKTVDDKGEEQEANIKDVSLNLAKPTDEKANWKLQVGIKADSFKEQEKREGSFTLLSESTGISYDFSLEVVKPKIEKKPEVNGTPEDPIYKKIPKKIVSLGWSWGKKLLSVWGIGLIILFFFLRGKIGKIGKHMKEKTFGIKRDDVAKFVKKGMKEKKPDEYQTKLNQLEGHIAQKQAFVEHIQNKTAEIVRFIEKLSVGPSPEDPHKDRTSPCHHSYKEYILYLRDHGLDEMAIKSDLLIRIIPTDKPDRETYARNIIKVLQWLVTITGDLSVFNNPEKIIEEHVKQAVLGVYKNNQIMWTKPNDPLREYITSENLTFPQLTHKIDQLVKTDGTNSLHEHFDSIGRLQNSYIDSINLKILQKEKKIPDPVTVRWLGNLIDRAVRRVKSSDTSSRTNTGGED